MGGDDLCYAYLDLYIILTPRIRYSSYYCCSVTKKTDVMVLAYVMVKQAQRAKRVAEGHQLEIGAQRAPRFLVPYNITTKKLRN